MPEYRLPDLAYDYTALEPHISGRIMEIYLQYQNRKTEFFEAVWNVRTGRTWRSVTASPARST